MPLSRILLLVAAGVSTLVAVGAFLQSPRSDLQHFYTAGRAWLDGVPLYDTSAGNLNLNPPLAVITLFVPVALLPPPIGRLLWFLANALALVSAFVVTRRELSWTHEQTTLAATLLLLTHPAWQIWLYGAYLGLLALPATLAWRAYRQGRVTNSGLWLTPVVVLKPPLAFVVAALPRRVWTTTVVASAGVCIVSLPVAGLTAWTDWWHTRRVVNWLNSIDNVSLVGQALRIMTGDTRHASLSDLPLALALLVGAVVMLGYRHVSRQHDADRRFALAWLTGVLASPLGWASYLVPGFAAFAASWTRAAVVPWALLCVPIYLLIQLESWYWFWIPGSIYTLGVTLAWFVWSDPHCATDPTLVKSIQAHSASARREL